MTDGNIVTSRNPDDVEAFTDALIDLIEGAPEATEIAPAKRASGLTGWQGLAAIRPHGRNEMRRMSNRLRARRVGRAWRRRSLRASLVDG